MYCICTCGGAAKKKFIHPQRTLIILVYFKNLRYPIQRLYQISHLLSVRELYIVKTEFKKYISTLKSKIRKDIIVHIPQTKTKFASIQYKKHSAYLYNRMNKQIYVYNKKQYELKKM